MLAKDIITTTASYLQLSLPQVCYQDSYTQELNCELVTNTALINLLMCLNNVLSELACDYVPNTKSEIIEAKNGVIDSTRLEGVMLDVLRLVDGYGNNVAYRHIVGGLLVDYDGALNIVYTTEYTKVNYLDEVKLSYEKIDCRVLAYGLACEYSLLQGDYDNAAMWDSRYKSCLLAGLSKRSSINMPCPRGWY